MLPMAIIGPKGVITGVPYPGQPAARAGGTRVNQFQGYVHMTGKTTRRTDVELETFPNNGQSGIQCTMQPVQIVKHLQKIYIFI